MVLGERLQLLFSNPDVPGEPNANVRLEHHWLLKRVRML